jgi:hypothetical protein
MANNKKGCRWFAGLYAVGLLALFAVSGLLKLLMGML